MSFEYNFSKWMRQVDAYVWVLAGCSMWDLVDHPWNDWHADRITPKAAARRAIEGLGTKSNHQGGGNMSAGWIRKSDGKRFETAPDHIGVSGQLLGDDGPIGYNEIRERDDVGSAESPYPVAICPDCGKVLLPRDIDDHVCF